MCSTLRSQWQCHPYVLSNTIWVDRFRQIHADHLYNFLPELFRAWRCFPYFLALGQNFWTLLHSSEYLAIWGVPVKLMIHYKQITVFSEKKKHLRLRGYTFSNKTIFDHHSWCQLAGEEKSRKAMQQELEDWNMPNWGRYFVFLENYPQLMTIWLRKMVFKIMGWVTIVMEVTGKFLKKRVKR